MDPLNNPVLRSAGPPQVVITNPAVCFYCHTSPLDATATYCPSCGFPQRGTEEEQKRFVTDKRILLFSLEGMREQAKRGRNMLFMACLLFAVSYTIASLKMGSFVFIEGTIVCGAFAGFGIWANKNAYPAVLTGLIFFITLLVVTGAIQPLSILSGIIFKIVILSGLIYGLKAAREAKKLEEELKTKKIDLSATA